MQYHQPGHYNNCSPLVCILYSQTADEGPLGFYEGYPRQHLELAGVELDPLVHHRG